MPLHSNQSALMLCLSLSFALGGAPLYPPASSAFAGQRKPVPASTLPDVRGVYTGSYQCDGERVRLDFEITSSTNGLIRANFTFFPPTPPPGAKTDNFSFSMQGQHVPDGETYLKPRLWRTRPPTGSGVVVVGLRGRFSPDYKTFSGAISGGGCGDFSVTRDEARSAEALEPAAPRASRADARSKPAPATPKPDVGDVKPSSPSPKPAPVVDPFVQQLGADTRLSGLEPTVVDLVMREASQEMRTCQSTHQWFGKTEKPVIDPFTFYNCECYVRQVFEWRMTQAGTAVTRRQNPRGEFYGPTYFVRDSGAMKLGQPFARHISECVAVDQVERETRRYVTAFQQMAQMSDAHRECVIDEIRSKVKPGIDVWADAYFRQLFKAATTACQKRK